MEVDNNEQNNNNNNNNLDQGSIAINIADHNIARLLKSINAQMESFSADPDLGGIATNITDHFTSLLFSFNAQIESFSNYPIIRVVTERFQNGDDEYMYQEDPNGEFLAEMNTYNKEMGDQVKFEEKINPDQILYQLFYPEDHIEVTSHDGMSDTDEANSEDEGETF